MAPVAVLELEDALVVVLVARAAAVAEKPEVARNCTVARPRTAGNDASALAKFQAVFAD